MGEVGFVPHSHDGELDIWVGALCDDDVARAGVEAARYPVGPAGTITVHSCCTVHGSAPNRSERPRPLLLQTYAAADAFSSTDLVRQSPRGEEVIRGAPARWARHDRVRASFRRRVRTARSSRSSCASGSAGNDAGTPG